MKGVITNDVQNLQVNQIQIKLLFQPHIPNKVRIRTNLVRIEQLCSNMILCDDVSIFCKDDETYRIVLKRISAVWRSKLSRLKSIQKQFTPSWIDGLISWVHQLDIHLVYIVANLCAVFSVWLVRCQGRPRSVCLTHCLKSQTQARSALVWRA